MLTDVRDQLIWAAGFLEGDGSFQNNKGGMTVSASQVQLDPVANLQVYFGGGISYRKDKRKNANNTYAWRLNGAHAAMIMMSIYDLMSPKRQKQIKECLVRWKKQQVRRLTGTHCAKGHPLTGGNVYWNGSWKYCLICSREYSKKSRNKYKSTMAQELTGKETHSG